MALKKFIDSTSIKVRAAVTVVVAICCGLVYVLVTLGSSYNANLQQQAEHAVEHAEKALEVVKSEDTDMLAAVSTALASREDLVDALRAQDAELLLTLSAPVFERLKTDHQITHLYFISPEGRVLLRTHRPSEVGDVLERATFRTAQLTGLPSGGLEIGKTAFALRYVRPIYANEPTSTADASTRGELLGYIEVAQEINRYLTVMARHTGDQYALVLLKNSLDRAEWARMRQHTNTRDNWDDDPRYVVASTTLPATAYSDWVKERLGTLSAEGDVPSIKDTHGTVITTGHFQVIDAFGNASGIMLVRHDLTSAATQLQAIRSGVAFAATTTAVILSILIIMLLDLLVFRRLLSMKSKMGEAVVRLGGPSQSEMTVGERTDEITAFERQLDLYRDHLEATIELRTEGLQQANIKLAQANTAKSRMLANMSHELRTPLNSIIGYTGVVLKGLAGPLTEEQEKQLGFVSRSGKQLLALVEDILDLSQIEAGRIGLKPSRFTVGGIINDVVTDSLPAAQRKGLELISPGGHEDLEIETDCGRLEQVLRNLVDNAIKYTPEGSVTVLAAPAGDNHVRFSVTDTGIGIAPEQHEWVFRAFTQTAETPEHRIGGVGLGLSICQLITRSLGGRLYLCSEKDKGSTVSVVVPRRLPVSPEQREGVSASLSVFTSADTLEGARAN